MTYCLQTALMPPRIPFDTAHPGQPYAHLDWAMAASHFQGGLLSPVSISDVHGHGFLI
jgi:hypothetical protein